MIGSVDNAVKYMFAHEVTVVKELVNSSAPKANQERRRESDDVLHISVSENVIEIDQDEEISEKGRQAGKGQQ